MCDYSKIINSIKLKSKLLLGIFLLIEIALFFILPSIVYFIIVSLLVYCAYLLLTSKIYAPITSALDTECDPEKFKQLFFSDINKKSALSTMSANFNISFLTGDFDAAVDYANSMVSDGRFNAVVSGLSNKAIAEFFKGDYVALKETVSKYSEKILNSFQIKKSELQLYINNETRLKLYVAISDNNLDEIKELSEQLTISNKTTLTRVQINFLKAVSSYVLSDYDAAKECADYVNNYGTKTVYAKQLSKYIK